MEATSSVDVTLDHIKQAAINSLTICFPTGPSLRSLLSLNFQDSIKPTPTSKLSFPGLQFPTIRLMASETIDGQMADSIHSPTLTQSAIMLVPTSKSYTGSAACTRNS
jgi:hypothetical protein